MTYYAKKSEWAAAKAREIRAQARALRLQSSGGSWRKAKRKFAGVDGLELSAQEWDRRAMRYQLEEDWQARFALSDKLQAEGRTFQQAVVEGDPEALRLASLPFLTPPRRRYTMAGTSSTRRARV